MNCLPSWLICFCEFACILGYSINHSPVDCQHFSVPPFQNSEEADTSKSNMSFFDQSSIDFPNASQTDNEGAWVFKQSLIQDGLLGPFCCNTVKPRNDGCQGSNKFDLLFVDF